VPLTAVTVSAYVPGFAEELAATFNVTTPEPGDAMELDESVAVTPVGAPVTVSATAAVRLVAAEVIVVGDDWPVLTVRLVNEAVSEREGAGVDASLQWFTRRLASMEPRPDARS
jgi:hypothetical protein